MSGVKRTDQHLGVGSESGPSEGEAEAVRADSCLSSLSSVVDVTSLASVQPDRADHEAFQPTPQVATLLTAVREGGDIIHSRDASLSSSPSSSTVVRHGPCLLTSEKDPRFRDIYLFIYLFTYFTTVAAHLDFSHRKFGSLSPEKASRDRVLLPNLRYMRGLSAFP